ncbi:MAG: hypothetical protein WDA11_05840, partial [Thiohalomonadaceae bacterium]
MPPELVQGAAVDYGFLTRKGVLPILHQGALVDVRIRKHHPRNAGRHGQRSAPRRPRTLCP